MTRSEYVSEGILLWQKFPITGIGLGTYQFQPESKYTFGGYTGLVALTEIGILGFIFLSGMIFFIFRDALKIKNGESEPDARCKIGRNNYLFI